MQASKYMQKCIFSFLAEKISSDSFPSPVSGYSLVHLLSPGEMHQKSIFSMLKGLLDDISDVFEHPGRVIQHFHSVFEYSMNDIKTNFVF